MKPILFSTPMVNALQEGTKAQTRRICQYNKAYDIFYDGKHEVEAEQTIENMKPCKYKVGDILWVRETWQHTKCLNLKDDNELYGYVYKASPNGKDFQVNMLHWKWKPSIFMPKEAARFYLQIEEVRCERLNDISEADAIAEGIEQEFDTFLDYSAKSKTGSYYLNAVESYATLWDKINDKGSWSKNPFVWVIKFNVMPF